MPKMKLIDNQSFFDACLVGCGSMVHAVEMAVLNNMSITTLTNAGDELDLPMVSNEMKTYFFVKKINVTTDVKIDVDGSFEIPMLFPLSL